MRKTVTWHGIRVSAMPEKKQVQYRYEVNIGGAVGTGTVIVPEDATDDQIRLAIMDDLYEVSYERTEENA